MFAADADWGSYPRFQTCKASEVKPRAEKKQSDLMYRVERRGRSGTFWNQ
jgi:hypothetical protein